MITIATNILNKLTAVHKKGIETQVERIFDQKNFSLQEYKEKGIDDSKQPKFFLGDLPLKEISTDIKIWDSFVKVLENIFVYSKEDIDDIIELQLWITSRPKPLPVNIFFSLKNTSDTFDKLQSLRDTLTISNVFDEKNIQAGKVLVVAYDSEGNAWRINYL